MLSTGKRSDSRAKLINNESASISIMQERKEYGNRKMSTSLTNDLMKRAIKVSMSINRAREYSKPIELNTWRNRLFLTFIVLLSISVGIVQVTQSGINIALGIWLKNPLRSAFVSFVIGSLCLLPFYFLCNNVEKTEILSFEKNYKMNDNEDSNGYHKDIIIPHKGSTSLSFSIYNHNSMKQESLKVITPKQTWINIKNALSQDIRNWIVTFHGALGVFFVCAVIYISPLIGFSLYYIAVVIGQIFCSMCIDNFGLFWAVKKRLTIINISGSFLAIIGAVIFQLPGFLGHHNYNYNWNTVGYFFIALFSGVSLTLKSTLDRKLKKIMNGTAYQSTFISFINSTLLLLIINIILYFIQNDWFQVNNDKFEWWIFCGGLLGPYIVTVYIIAPSYIGFVATFILAIFGSLMTSFIFDITGAFGVDVHNSFTFWEIIGMILVLAGAFMVNVRRNKKFKKRIKINDFSAKLDPTELEKKNKVFDTKDNGTKYLYLPDDEEEEDIYSTGTD